MEYFGGEYDVVVIGGGHAGCEAGCAAAKLGMKTALFTISLDAVGNMACNPNIGGSAKGHLVREIDALGGIMGKAADKTFIQSRTLNKGKGPAVWSLRAQTDRWAYRNEIKRIIEYTENLDVRQSEIVEILFDENRHVTGVKTENGAIIKARAVVVATGTYLGGKVITGENIRPGGPDGMLPASKLTSSLLKNGIEIVRFKTGTPPRISGKTVDFSVMEPQYGDEKIVPFSFEAEGTFENKVCCYLTYTNQKTHEIIRQNLHRAPLFSGVIEGVGPRYCPSIEDKVVRFADKERHQIFIEPMGLNSDEMYVQGLSSSMPEDIQIQMLHSIKGLENCKIMRTAYAIEYDCINPLQLKSSLEFKEYGGLFGAGQFNGSSGYEEAASQGLMAGINAALLLKGEEPFVIGRDEGYIGVLIDDLVTKGTNEPYRMMTSRSEYRLLLRQDNADERLTPKGHKIGMISDERFEKFTDKMNSIDKEIHRLSKTSVPSSDKLNEILKKCDTEPVSTGIRLSDLLRRPQVTYDDLEPVDTTRPKLSHEICEEAEIRIKYDGYIRRQKTIVEQFRKLENKKIPSDFDFSEIKGLRIEARQKLCAAKPENIGKASRISGVSPADISVLLVALEWKKHE